MLTELRKTLSKLERKTRINDAGFLPFGILPIDATLGGGLAYGALHEIAAASESHIAAATGFVLGIASSHRAIVWITQDMALVESGAPCGTGLDEASYHPERFITVTVTRTHDLLWAMEEALRSCAVMTVIGEVRDEHIESVALRRLSLAATANGAIALLLRTSPDREASTAATRWVVSGALSQPRYGPGLPRINAQLTRNRKGPLGNWTLEWSDTDERFALARTNPQPVAQPVINRPARKAVA
jgi:protein ImuA